MRDHTFFQLIYIFFVLFSVLSLFVIFQNLSKNLFLKGRNTFRTITLSPKTFSPISLSDLIQFEAKKFARRHDALKMTEMYGSRLAKNIRA